MISYQSLLLSTIVLNDNGDDRPYNGGDDHL